MPYPFPGMNPWLENPALWHSVHQSLIVALRDELAPRLRPRYFVALETHTYIAFIPDEPPAETYPDVMIVNQSGPAVRVATASETAPYVTVALPIAEPIEESYLEIRAMPRGEVVTVIEILSHANKRPSRDRDTYLQKREALLASSVHLVEIDLLRSGPPMPYTQRPPGHYRLFVRRAEHPRQAQLYNFNFRDPLPVFPLPLRPDDTEPPVDLGALLQGVYDRAGYDMVINYQQPPTPPLSEDDAAWAAGQLGRVG